MNESVCIFNINYLFFCLQFFNLGHLEKKKKECLLPWISSSAVLLAWPTIAYPCSFPDIRFRTQISAESVVLQNVFRSLELCWHMKSGVWLWITKHSGDGHWAACLLLSVWSISREFFFYFSFQISTACYFTVGVVFHILGAHKFLMI